MRRTWRKWFYEGCEDVKGKADPEGTMRIKDERETENLTFELLVDSKKLIMACNTFCYISFFFFGGLAAVFVFWYC